MGPKWPLWNWGHFNNSDHQDSQSYVARSCLAGLVNCLSQIWEGLIGPSPSLLNCGLTGGFRDVRSQYLQMRTHWWLHQILSQDPGYTNWAPNKQKGRNKYWKGNIQRGIGRNGREVKEGGEARTSKYIIDVWLLVKEKTQLLKRWRMTECRQWTWVSDNRGHQASCFFTSNAGGAFYDALQLKTTLYYPVVHNLLFFLLRCGYLEIKFD